MPAISFARVVIVAVYVVLNARLVVGAKLAVLPKYVTNPVTAVVPCLKVKVVESIVAGFITLLKVALIIFVTGTLISPLFGSVDITLGGIVSGATPVVKVHT